MKIQGKLHRITDLPKLVASFLKPGGTPIQGSSALLAPVLLALFTSACITPSPPKIHYWEKQGDTTVKVTSVELRTGGVEIGCVANDNEVIKSIELYFTGNKADTCTSAGEIQGGSFTVLLPNPQKNEFNDVNTAPTVTNLQAKVAYPSCTIAGVEGPEPGVPVGHIITAHCKAQNFGSDPQNKTAEATLQIKVK